MFIKYFASFIVVILLFNGGSLFLYAQTNADNNAEKVKADVLKRGTSEKKSVRVKLLSGTKMKGYISQIGDDSFTLKDSKTKQPKVIAYRDTAKVEGRGLAGGAKVGIIVAAAAGATLIILYAAFQNAIRNN